MGRWLILVGLTIAAALWLLRFGRHVQLGRDVGWSHYFRYKKEFYRL